MKEDHSYDRLRGEIFFFDFYVCSEEFSHVGFGIVMCDVCGMDISPKRKEGTYGKWVRGAMIVIRKSKTWCSQDINMSKTSAKDWNWVFAAK